VTRRRISFSHGIIALSVLVRILSPAPASAGEPVTADPGWSQNMPSGDILPPEHPDSEPNNSATTVFQFIFGLSPGSRQDVYRDGALICTLTVGMAGAATFYSPAGENFEIRPDAASSVDPSSRGPSALQLRSYPNPMKSETTLRFDLPVSGLVRLDIFDLQGRVLKTLLNGRRNEGRGTINWNGRAEDNTKVRDGVYFARLVALGTSRIVKLTVMRHLP
jgi:hypothetical protein